MFLPNKFWNEGRNGHDTGSSSSSSSSAPKIVMKQQCYLSLLFNLFLLWTLLSILLLTRFLVQQSIAEDTFYKQYGTIMGTMKQDGLFETHPTTNIRPKDENEETMFLDGLHIENRRFQSVWNLPLPGQTQRYYSNPQRLDELVERGPHFLTTTSGCRIARWYYPTPHKKPQYRDCSKVGQDKRLTLDRLSQVRTGDTIYVTHLRLEHFVTNVLDQLTTNVVIMSGQIQNVPPMSTNATTLLSTTLLNHRHILHWFCQNIPIYVNASNRNHPKLSPFPYGLKQVIQRPNTLNEPLQAFRRVFMETLEIEMVKNQTLFRGYLRPSTPLRKALSSNHVTTPLSPYDYFYQVAQSQYILSPNGDRPECFRHYESIGLGTIPITELDPRWFSHLQDAPIIYFGSATKDWTEFQHNPHFNMIDVTTTVTTTTNRVGTIVVNRNLVMEEYWMEYMDWKVGRLLTWWDVQRQRPMVVPQLFRSTNVQ